MIIYLHGFSSSAASQKSAFLQHALHPLLVRVPDYPCHQPGAAIALLSAYIQQQDARAIMLIGSSLGGYYAQYLAARSQYVSRAVLINPALQPQVTLKPHLGFNRNMQSGDTFEFQQRDFDQLALFDVPRVQECAPSLVLLDQGDEVIDYRVAQNKYSAHGQVLVYSGGSHRFEHLAQSIESILNFYHSSM